MTKSDRQTACHNKVNKELREVCESSHSNCSHRKSIGFHGDWKHFVANEYPLIVLMRSCLELQLRHARRGGVLSTRGGKGLASVVEGPHVQNVAACSNRLRCIAHLLSDCPSPTRIHTIDSSSDNSKQPCHSKVTDCSDPCGRWRHIGGS